MARNGSGVQSSPAASYPAVASTLIESAKFNAVINDINSEITNSIAVDGQSVVTAHIPFAGFKLTGVGAATARTDAATLASTQDGTGTYVATVGGTADAITLTPSPAITAYVAGQRFTFIVGSTNTTAVTVAVSGLTAKSITINGSTAVVAGSLLTGSLVTITYDGTRFQLSPIGTLANGLSFPAAQVTSANVNTLDDYEEGTWTPSIGGTATYNTQSGTYTKIGNMVNVRGFVSINVIGTGSTTVLSGLPFAALTNRQAGAVDYYVNLAVNTIFLAPGIQAGAATVTFNGAAASSATMSSGIAVFGSGTDIRFNITYIT